MAGAGYKLFNTGDVLTAAQVNTYLNEQTVMVFASSAARTSALSGVLAEGMVSYLQDTNAVEVYNGSAWVGVSGAGDVTEVQAGTGISVASGTGPIPVVTNTMATAIDAEGDLIIGDAADAFQRLAIGSNTHVLTVDTSVDGKIKWAAPAAGANLNANRTYVSTQESTTSSSYTDLTTSQAVTLTTGTKALVALSCRTLNGSTASINMGISFGVSGATTVSAADQYGTLQFYGAATNAQFAVSSAVVITGLTAGSNTFTMKFKSNGSNSAFFENRNISVVDLGS